MTINQYRGDPAALLGDVLATARPVRAQDSVRVSAKLSAPAHCYLIAFNPDGTEQLCYPEDPDLPTVIFPEHKDRAQAMATQPAKNAELQFPRDQYFEPGIPGLQVFVLLASAEPLRPYAEWRSGVDAIPWQKADKYDQPLRWQFDGGEFTFFPNDRGERVERGAPKEVRELCKFFQGRPEFQAVRAIAFPVTKE